MESMITENSTEFKEFAAQITPYRRYLINASLVIIVMVRRVLVLFARVMMVSHGGSEEDIIAPVALVFPPPAWP